MICFSRQFLMSWVILGLFALVWPSATSAQRPEKLEPLWFSLQPKNAGGPPAKDGKQHSGRPTGRPASQPRVQDSHHGSGDRPAGNTGGRPSHGYGGRPRSRFESEHRAMPARKYFLNGPAVSSTAIGYILHADRSVSDLPINQGEQTSVAVNLPMGEGLGSHGANNVYAVDQQVLGETLYVRNAKWLTIHHSCGWGHGPKFDEPRQKSQSLDKIPLEIVVDNLWDPNFHSTVMSGDEIHLKVLHFGQPAPGARVTVTSEKGWTKSLITDDSGAAKFQLVRDYYPTSWSAFHRTEKGRVKFLAEYRTNESGEMGGLNYSRTKYSATFPWRYYPAQREYTSLMIGLLVVLFGAGISGLAVFFFRQRRQTGLKKLVFHE